PPAVFTADLGDTLTFRGKDNHTVNKTVIGVLDTTVMQGVYSYSRHLAEEFEGSGPTFFLLGTASGVDGDRAARELEREFLPYGMQTTVMKTVVQEIIRVMNQFFNLFEAFMALGLVIGIAGLGIITIRSVHERRQEIGMLRAIGFRQRDVLSSFLIETSFVAVLGIVIGTLLGVFIGYTLWHDEFRPEGFTFAINWQPILLVAAVALVVTLLSVVPASRKASRVPPAEALRYQD
ncbi:MAG: ABC transporter permease, partial [Thermoplasmatota archaeon]